VAITIYSANKANTYYATAYNL